MQPRYFLFISAINEQQVIVALLSQLPDECKLHIKFECIDATEAKGTFAGRQLREGEFDAVTIMGRTKGFWRSKSWAVKYITAQIRIPGRRGIIMGHSI